MEDETLIQHIKSGDLDSLDQLIQKYYGDVYSYCCRKLERQDDAQDVTQEVFLHFCRNFDSYIQRSKIKTYLYTIARNLCINTMLKKTPIPLEDAELESLSVKDAAEDKFEAASIKTALNALPEEQKEAILLRFYHDLKIKEIARIMDSGLSVTKYRLYQGLETLSESLSKEDWL